MREYPRTVYRGKDDYKRVYNETEEIQAGDEGYESHFDVECIKEQKGTDRAILKAPSNSEDNSETSIPVIEEINTQELTRGQKIALSRKRNKEK